MEYEKVLYTMNLSGNRILKLSGFNHPRRESDRDSTAFAADEGRSNHLMNKWNLIDSELCKADIPSGIIQKIKHEYTISQEV